jgi:uncharacterized protein
MNMIRFRCLLLFALILTGMGAHAQTSKPKAIPNPPSTYVYDETNSLSPQAKAQLFTFLSEEDRTAGNQILIAIFQSLDNEDLVDYTSQVFKKWSPGQKGKNNGLLIAAYLKEHKIRIEVGYGLEPVITDAKSKEIILNDLAPAFKAGTIEEGVMKAISDLAVLIHQGQELDGSASPGSNGATAGRTEGPAHLPVGVLVLLLILLFLVVKLILFSGPEGRAFLLGMLLGSLGGRGGGGGFGGGDGGGFSGGGGMSGGGGASGDW